MKTITKYQANDGTEFPNANDCLAHEKLCQLVARVMSKLPAQPENDGCNFANGSGYLQHHPADFWSAYKQLLQLAVGEVVQYGNFDVFFKAINDPLAIHISHIERIISECCPKVIIRAFYRFRCTSFQTLREYGQPYYAAHPDDAQDLRLNP